VTLGMWAALSAPRLLTLESVCWLRLPTSLPRLDEIAIDPGVFCVYFRYFRAGRILLSHPVFKYAGASLGTSLREGGRTIERGRATLRARNLLVVVQWLSRWCCLSVPDS